MWRRRRQQQQQAPPPPPHVEQGRDKERRRRPGLVDGDAVVIGGGGGGVRTPCIDPHTERRAAAIGRRRRCERRRRRRRRRLQRGDAERRVGPVTLSPTTSFSFNVDDLLKIVSVARARYGDARQGVAEVMQPPRGQPLIGVMASPPTRGPLEALWATTDPLILQAASVETHDELIAAAGGGAGGVEADEEAGDGDECADGGEEDGGAAVAQRKEKRARLHGTPASAAAPTPPEWRVVRPHPPRWAGRLHERRERSAQ